MKRNLLLAMMIVAAGCLSAQNGDTIWGRCADYLYPEWYDECYYYTNDGGFVAGLVPVYFYTDEHGNPNGSLMAEMQSVPAPVSIEGVALMVSTRRQMYPSLTTERAVEYAILMGVDSNGQPRDTLAMGRWDTVAPRVMLLPQNIRAEHSGDTTNSLRDFLVYEARFPQPVLVDTQFFIAATFNSNERTPRDSNGVRRYKYKTTSYITVMAYQNPCDSCMTGVPRANFSPNDGWHMVIGSPMVGPFMAIVAGYDLTVLTADSLMGSATGSGTYRSGVPAVIRATAARFCRFTSWSDGSTDNPRVMYLYQDSTVTANFAHDSSSYVRVLPNNPAWGSTSGTGIYPYGQSVDIAAVAAEGYLFTEWADGSQDNPRTVLPVGDTVFTAIFDPVPVGVSEPYATEPEFTVTPNPTQGSVTIRCAEGSHTLQLYDGSGRMVFTRTFIGSMATVDVATLSSGIYTAVLRTAGRKEAKTLIKL